MHINDNEKIIKKYIKDYFATKTEVKKIRDQIYHFVFNSLISIENAPLIY